MLNDDDVTLYGLFVEAFSRLKPLVHEDLGVPDTWFEVLLRLGRTPGHALRMSDLAAAVAFSSGGFTRLADRMEEAGLIRREPDPDDRRAALAALTPEGEKALDRALSRHLAHLRTHMSDRLTEEDRRAFERVLRVLRDGDA
ncbi:MarR family winged helix-turn-helix transcriptional regulator [Streptomyces albireticuli]|nr:MarR family transcriptional regulator [Streptomyces albireticuli]MCD9144253.1 MarR family transcriptional regulator [Streptomyces albireticuli]MCD9162104.1 MarR family transcriptional regulator [Streptomyces albireticuli]MCD9193890.1 MarR family transcriptional regulator [Streptomyces albireticuli]